jgi:hypothetical protein
VRFSLNTGHIVLKDHPRGYSRHRIHADPFYERGEQWLDLRGEHCLDFQSGLVVVLPLGLGAGYGVLLQLVTFAPGIVLIELAGD